MSNIKKVYQELVQFLESNNNKKVSTILDQVIEMCSSKVQSKTFIKDDNDEVIAIFCYYHKAWEDPRIVEYGRKVSNKATGLNTMCKTGMNEWTKQQSRLKKVDSVVLDLLEKGEIDVTEFKEKRQELEEIARQPQEDAIVPESIDQETIDELLK